MINLLFAIVACDESIDARAARITSCEAVSILSDFRKFPACISILPSHPTEQHRS